MMVPTIAMCIFMGIFPNVFLHPMEASVRKVVDQVHGVSAVASASSAPRPVPRAQRAASGGGR
jgi:NADH:ubiquinone oxidoreductase subunit 4 (subunit M)